MTWLHPTTLMGDQGSLVPLSHEHHDMLCQAAEDGKLWQLWYTSVPHPREMSAEIDRRLRLKELGSMLPFTVLDPDGQVAGMTTFMNVDNEFLRVEIGSTWYAKRCHRTGLNTQCKLLLLEHAFESLDCIAVELRTSSLNQQSRRAIERLGAKLDGVEPSR